MPNFSASRIRRSAFAVTLRARHAEVAEDLPFGVTALLVADDHHRFAVESRQTANDGVVVGKGPVAVQFLEIGKDQAQVIKRVGPLRMTRHLADLPRRKPGIDLPGQDFALFLQASDFFGDVDGRIILRQAQRLDLPFEVGDRLFKVEETGFHQAQP
jgi:hypothetical protein